MSITKTIVHISSKHRMADEDITDFRVELRQKLQNCFRVVPQSAVIPNTFYNVPSTKNTFNYNIATVGNVNLTLTPGYYSLTTGADNNIIDALNAQIVSVTGGANSWFSFDLVTLKITLQHDANNVAVLGTGTMNEVLGYSADGQSATGLTAVAPNAVDLRGVETIYVHLSFVENGHYLSEARQGIDVALQEDVLCKIPMNSPFGSTVFWEVNEEELLGFNFRGLRNISNFKIRLSDENNNTVDTNGLNWNIDLVCYE